jgi:hypothetical protein
MIPPFVTARIASYFFPLTLIFDSCNITNRCGKINEEICTNNMVVVLWREEWLKPLYDLDIGSEVCKSCKKRFEDIDFVTSCEFCQIGIIHSSCADNHILNNHKHEIINKIQSQRDRRLHDYQ